MLKMRPQFFGIMSGIIFLFAAVLHSLRATYEWELVLNGWMVPVSVSWTVALVGFLMAYFAFRLTR